ncbi:lipoate--protein ligase family protein [Arcanobacterium haemolyticum]|nr:lipoate--protein ligase family protein [Arcanobacterium haemolyticum]
MTEKKAGGNLEAVDNSAHVEFPARIDVLSSAPLPVGINLALDHAVAESVARGARPASVRLWSWREKSAIIGSSQSLSNEIDIDEAARRGITVARRTSGGGTMFMDPAKAITYSVIVPTSALGALSMQDSYALLDSWVLEALRRLGVPAFYRPINDIATADGKIGGAAQRRLASGVTIHHATLSWDIDDEELLAVTRLFRDDLGHRGTKSAQKKVVGVRRYAAVTRRDVNDTMLDCLVGGRDARPSSYRPDELEGALALAARKFDDPGWTGRIP